MLVITGWVGVESRKVGDEDGGNSSHNRYYTCSGRVIIVIAILPGLHPKRFKLTAINHLSKKLDWGGGCTYASAGQTGWPPRAPSL